MVYVLVLLLILIPLLFRRTQYPKIHGIFRNGYGFPNYIKKIVLYFLLKIYCAMLKRRRIKNPTTELKMDDIFELPSSEPYAMNSVAFNCCDPSGNIFVARISRRNNGKAEIWMSMRLADGRLLFHPCYPVSLVSDYSGKSPETNVHFISAGGMEVHFVVPLQVLLFTYSGKLRVAQINETNVSMEQLLGSKSSTYEEVSVEMKLWFRAFSDPVEALSTDLDPWAAACTIACENLGSLGKKGKSYRTNLQQGGELSGDMKLNGVKYELFMHGLRTRTVGLRNWRNFAGYCVHCGRFNNGTVIALGVLSQTDGLSHALSGYMIEPSGKIHSISWSDLHLASLPGVHFPGCNLPFEYSINFSLGTSVHTLKVTRLAALPICHGGDKSVDIMVNQNLVRFELDGSEQGFGSVEYQHGLTPVEYTQYLEDESPIPNLDKMYDKRSNIDEDCTELSREFDTPIASFDELSSLIPLNIMDSQFSPLTLSYCLRHSTRVYEDRFSSQTLIPKRWQVPRLFSVRSGNLFLNSNFVSLKPNLWFQSDTDKEHFGVDSSLNYEKLLKRFNAQIGSQFETSFVLPNFWLMITMAEKLSKSSAVKEFQGYEVMEAIEKLCQDELESLISMTNSPLMSFELDASKVSFLNEQLLQKSICLVLKHFPSFPKPHNLRKPSDPFESLRTAVRLVANDKNVDAGLLCYLNHVEFESFRVGKADSSILEKAKQRKCFSETYKCTPPKQIASSKVQIITGTVTHISSTKLIRVTDDVAKGLLINPGDCLVFQCIGQAVHRLAHLFPILNGLIIEEAVDEKCQTVAWPNLFNTIRYCCDNFGLVCILGSGNLKPLEGQLVKIDGNNGRIIMANEY